MNCKISLKEESKLDKFKGNVLTDEEKVYRLNKLNEELKKGEIDSEFIPYLSLINKYRVVTTQCCCGHNGKKKAHFDFRSQLSVEETINKLIRPLQDAYLGITVELITECDRLRYIVWLTSNWREEVTNFIEILKEASVVTINIGRDFNNDILVFRYKCDGSFSGEEFRKNFLEKHFKNINNEYAIKIYLDGTGGYSTAFLEEAFGGLARKYTLDRCKRRLKFISEDNVLIDEIYGYMDGSIYQLKKPLSLF